jgi:hypothetical protein
MNAKAKVRWLNARNPFKDKWSVGEDVYCLHCEWVFKAEDVIEDEEGDPNCPHCHRSSPIDFLKEPSWRDDLIEQSATRFRIINKWRVKPIRATRGHPIPLPPRSSIANN